MSGAPILLLLVVLWGAYLVPRLLARYDRAVDFRSADQFRLARRALSESLPPSGGLLAGSLALSPQERRRRALLVLGGVVVVTLLLAVVGTPLLWIPQALADLALVVFLVHLRRIVLAEGARRRAARRRAAPARPHTSGAAAQPATTAPPLTAPPQAPSYQAPSHQTASHQTASYQTAPVLVPSSAPAHEPAAERPAPRVAAAQFAASQIAAEQPAARRPAFFDDSTWLPVPVPAPLYTTAATAPRVLDLTVPGRWTAASVLAEIEAVAPVHDDTLEMDAIDTGFMQRLRAVGD